MAGSVRGVEAPRTCRREVRPMGPPCAGRRASSCGRGGRCSGRPGTCRRGAPAVRFRGARPLRAAGAERHGEEGTPPCRCPRRRPGGRPPPRHPMRRVCGGLRRRMPAGGDGGRRMNDRGGTARCRPVRAGAARRVPPPHPAVTARAGRIQTHPPRLGRSAGMAPRRWRGAAAAVPSRSRSETPHRLRPGRPHRRPRPHPRTCRGIGVTGASGHGWHRALAGASGRRRATPPARAAAPWRKIDHRPRSRRPGTPRRPLRAIPGPCRRGAISAIQCGPPGPAARPPTPTR